MKIVIIGTGNVAATFGRLLAKAGHQMLQVYGQTEAHAALLAEVLSTEYVTDWEAVRTDADLYLVALSDKALYKVGEYLNLPGKVVAHTAGSVPMDVLSKVTGHYGVLYPLQSLKTSMPVITEIPLLINAVSEPARSLLLEVAGTISANVTFATDAERLAYHVAAVFVNNFTNHLFAVAEAYCNREGLEFDRLLPLANETTRRLSVMSPAQSMTGPAVRGDTVTVQEHLALLQAYPQAHDLYAFLTTSIERFRNGEKESKTAE